MKQRMPAYRSLKECKLGMHRFTSLSLLVRKIRVMTE